MITDHDLDEQARFAVMLRGQATLAREFIDRETGRIVRDARSFVDTIQASGFQQGAQLLPAWLEQWADNIDADVAAQRKEKDG